MENKSGFCGLLAGAMLAALIVLVVKFQKIDAMWGPVSVVLIGIIVAALVAFVLTRFEWYQEPYDSARTLLLGVLVVGFILTAFLGVYFTEPIESGGTLTQSQVDSRGRQAYDYGASRTGHWYFLNFGGGTSSSSSSSSGSSSSKIDLDDGGEALAYLFIILLVVALVIASAIVPHFWIVALLTITVLMAMVAWRETKVGTVRHRHYTW